MGYGELAALAAAMLWAIASVLFRMAGTKVAPWTLNLYKGVLACVGFIAIIFFAGDDVTALPLSATALLMLSGLIGIGIGDTAFFIALNRLGERQAVLLAETLAPGIAYVLGFIVLGEVLKLPALGGMLLTVLGVGIAIAPSRWTFKTNAAAGGQAASWFREQGIWMAVVAAACQAIGVVLARLAFAESEASAAESGLLRLLGGLAIISTVVGTKFIAACCFAKKESGKVTGTTAVRATAQAQTLSDTASGRQFHGQSVGLQSKAGDTAADSTGPRLNASTGNGSLRTFALIFLATVLGTWIGIYLQQTSLIYSNAVVTQTLISTSVLFVIPMAWLLGDAVQWKSVMGAVIAFAGVALIVGS